jgi:hypothetical protein
MWSNTANPNNFLYLATTSTYLPDYILPLQRHTATKGMNCWFVKTGLQAPPAPASPSTPNTRVWETKEQLATGWQQAPR